MQNEIQMDPEIRQIRQLQNVLAISQRCEALLHLVGPTDENYGSRQFILQQVCNRISAVFPDALLVPYGSFVSKCYLYNSDIDFCCWNPGKDPRETFQTCVKIVSEIPDVQSIQPIDAEVPVIRCIINGIGCDISFSQPAGIITAFLIDLIDSISGRNHLFKRSLVLIQSYMMNEIHCLGSHNFMLSSYALRTMVGFILLQLPGVQSPIQVLLAFLAFFAQFDFENNIITLFGITPINGHGSIGQMDAVLKELRVRFEQGSGRGMCGQKLTAQVSHLIALRAACDEKSARVMQMSSEIQKIIETGGEETAEEESSFACELRQGVQRVSKQKFNADASREAPLEQRKAITEIAMEQFLRTKSIQQYCKDEGSFSCRFVNVSDPLMPSNNLGKSVSKRSLLRMQRAIQLGHMQLQSLLENCISGEATVVQVLGDFDLLFPNTLATIQPSKGKLDFDAGMADLDRSALRVVLQNFGFRFSGIVWKQ